MLKKCLKDPCSGHQRQHGYFLVCLTLAPRSGASKCNTPKTSLFVSRPRVYCVKAPAGQEYSKPTRNLTVNPCLNPMGSLWVFPLAVTMLSGHPPLVIPWCALAPSLCKPLFFAYVCATNDKPSAVAGLAWSYLALVYSGQVLFPFSNLLVSSAVTSPE